MKIGGILCIYGETKKERDRMVAIWFQMAELVWKSRYYIHTTDDAGIKMTEYELIGDALKWTHKSTVKEDVAKNDS